MRIANNRFLSKQRLVCLHAAILVVATGLFFDVMAPAVGMEQAAPLQVPALGGMPIPPTPSALPPPLPPSAPSAQTLEQGQTTKIESGVSEINKNVSALEDKASDNAKSVLKHLDTSSDAVTLEDLNVARQAVTRLDAMIEVEKHLSEFEKMRSERTGNNHALANAIPASALMPVPPSATASVTPPPPTSAELKREELIRREHEVKMAEKKTAAMEVTRISGADGVYTAVLKLDDGTSKTVRIGEHLSGNSVVRSISPSSVVVEAGGEIRNLHVKNIDVLYSAMR